MDGEDGWGHVFLLRSLQDFNQWQQRSVVSYKWYGNLSDCGPSSLQVIVQVLLSSSGLIPHLSHDH